MNTRPPFLKNSVLITSCRCRKSKKVVINIGVGEALENPKALDAAVNDLTIITGQKPIIIAAKKAISNFKLREGRQIGVKVTLRGEKMWAFLDRLINVALPRVRDFRGVSRLTPLTVAATIL